MPKLKSKDEPEGVRPYLFHGVDLHYSSGDENAIAECPFCGRENKFAVEIETSKFRCFVCDETGNSVSFLQKFWNLCYQQTTPTEYDQLAADSGFVNRDSANVFGLAKSLLTDEWLVPGFNAEAKLTGLYRYAYFGHEKKYRLLPTPGMGHHLFNVHNYEEQKPIVDLFEGWRDAIAWMEATDLPESSHSGQPLHVDRNVLAIAGTNSFKTWWSSLFAGKTVNLFFDNDHPREHPRTGDTIQPAGLTGIKKVASMLMSAKNPPEKIQFVAWEDNEKGYSLDLPSGHDVRDHLNQ